MERNNMYPPSNNYCEPIEVEKSGKITSEMITIAHLIEELGYVIDNLEAKLTPVLDPFQGIADTPNETGVNMKNQELKYPPMANELNGQVRLMDKKVASLKNIIHRINI